MRIRDCVKNSDRIYFELMGKDRPVEAIMDLYDNSEDKRDFAIAMAMTLLLLKRKGEATAHTSLAV